MKFISIFCFLVCAKLYESRIIRAPETFLIADWMEVGFVPAVHSDKFVPVTSTGRRFVDPVVLMSSIDSGNKNPYSGFMACTRLKDITLHTDPKDPGADPLKSPGYVTFAVRITQPNDSWCNYTWWVI